MTAKITSVPTKALFILFILGLMLIFSACGKSEKGEPALKATLSGDLTPASGADDSWQTAQIAGLQWSVPAGWEVGPPKPMRAGTYFAPAVGGDSEPAECRVNYFGSGQGGGIEGNIARWASQMKSADNPNARPTPVVSNSTVHGQPVTLVELSGTYLGGGPMMGGGGEEKPDFKMFAAIIGAPEGTVFFKMTGPAATMESAREDFRKLLGSAQPAS